ncbi:hypothetical protein Droror1_Dr00007878 [Drosera rotundifolia]
MARSLSNAKILSALLADNISLALNRRGFCNAATEAAKAVNASAAKMAQDAEEEIRNKVIENWWVPDPVTGYYMPMGRGNHVDPAVLREKVLGKKKNNN